MKENTYKLVSFKKEVVIPHELTDKFLKYLEKFGKFTFHTYLIDEDNICEVSKYKINICNLNNPINAVFNNVFEADIDFEVIEKHIEHKVKYFSGLLNLLNEANINAPKYSIQIYEAYDMLQAKIFVV